MVSRLLFLEEGQLRRAWPFFALYLVLFAALTLADGLSLAMFVARLGAEQLPRLQALSAVCVMLAVGWYLHTADSSGGDRVFVAILAGPLLLFTLVWSGLASQLLDERCLGLLFLGRELAFALVLLHFGAYLQEYFTRCELHRVMPVIYAGGRLGGIAGGVALERLSQLVEPVHLLLLIAGLLAASIAGVQWIHRRTAPVAETAERAAIQDAQSIGDVANGRMPQAASRDTATLGGFLTFAGRSPLLLWIMASTVVLFVCRAGLVLQYNMCFQREFADAAALAAFLGRYTQIALAASLLFQLLFVGRLVARIGLRGAQLVYASLVVAAAVGGFGPMPLAAAVFARFVETELRYGLRNPLAQMTVSLFPRPIRTRVRAWSLGVLIPGATIVASLGIDLLLRADAVVALTVLTLAAAGGYLVASLGLTRSLRETRKSDEETIQPTVSSSREAVVASLTPLGSLKAAEVK